MEVTRTELEKECSAMTDEQLTSALTIEKATFTDDFCQIALEELKKRNYDLSSAKVSLNNEGEAAFPIDKALEQVREDISQLDAWYYTNALGETLVIVKGFSYWEIHHVYLNKYIRTFFVEPFQKVTKILDTFLNINKWDDTIGKEYYINEWNMFITTSSYDYTERMSKRLSQLEILSAVETEALSHFTEIYSPYRKAAFTIFVPYEQSDDAEKILEEDRTRIDALYDKLEETNPPENELEVYNELIDLDPDDAMAFHNRGVIFYEDEKYNEAAESFIQSASLIMTFNESEDIVEEAEEILEESENALIQIVEKLPDNLGILHILASIAWYKGDLEQSKEYYKKILSLSAEDKVAKENLDYLEKINKIEPM